MHNIIKTTLLLALFATQSHASQCFHHFNPAAWHNQGTAIVLCLNSGEMNNCDVYFEGQKVLDLYKHGNTDHDRVVWTNYNVMLDVAPLDVLCRGDNNKYYNYRIPNVSGMFNPGVCTIGRNYIGPEEFCGEDHEPILSVEKVGRGTGTVTSDQIGLGGKALNCDSICQSDSQSFFANLQQKVTLTATPDEGYSFLGWDGECEAVEECIPVEEGDCEEPKACIVTMGSDKNIMARFEPINALPAILSLLILNKRYTDAQPDN